MFAPRKFRARLGGKTKRFEPTSLGFPTVPRQSNVVLIMTDGSDAVETVVRQSPSGATLSVTTVVLTNWYRKLSTSGDCRTKNRNGGVDCLLLSPAIINASSDDTMLDEHDLMWRRDTFSNAGAEV